MDVLSLKNAYDSMPKRSFFRLGEQKQPICAIASSIIVQDKSSLHSSSLFLRTALSKPASR